MLGEVQNQMPFACDMSALTAAQRAEHGDTMRRLFGAVSAIHAVQDGYRFVLSGDDESIKLTGPFIALERRCCPFFTFRLDVAADAEPALVISGPTGVQPFIQAEFGAVLPDDVRFPADGQGAA